MQDRKLLHRLFMICLDFSSILKLKKKMLRNPGLTWERYHCFKEIPLLLTKVMGQKREEMVYYGRYVLMGRREKMDEKLETNDEKTKERIDWKKELFYVHVVQNCFKCNAELIVNINLCSSSPFRSTFDGKVCFKLHSL